MTKLKVVELVDWIMENRTGQAFRDYSRDKVAMVINHAIEQQVFATVYWENVGFIGVAVGEKNDEYKVVTIHDVLTTHKKALPAMMVVCATSYPDYTIRGTKRGNKERIFRNPQRLLTLLTPKGTI